MDTRPTACGGGGPDLSTPRDSSPSTIFDRDTQQPNDVEKTTPATAADDPDAPPDGGLAAWTVVLGGFCTVFASFGWINCIGIFQDYYQHHQLASYSSSTVAWITSTESFMMFFWGPVVGKMTDDLGPRIPVLIGSFLHVFGLMMTSLSKEYYQIFLAQSVCSAIGCSFLFYARKCRLLLPSSFLVLTGHTAIAALGTWFRRHRAFAFGIVTAGSSLGGVVLPIMVNHLVVSAGFAWAMRATAFLFLGLLIIGNLTVKSRLPPPKRPFKFMAFIVPFYERPFLLLTIGTFMIYIGAFLPFNFIIVQAKAAGMSASLACYMVSIINASSTFGRIIPAYAGDRVGVLNVMLLFTLLGGIFTLAIWLPAHSNAPLIVYGVLYGFSSGCTLSIIPAIVASMSDVRDLGTRNGSLYVFAAIATLVGNPIGGAIVSRQNGSFSGLIIFSGVTALFGTAIVVLVRHSLVGPTLWKKV